MTTKISVSSKPKRQAHNAGYDILLYKMSVKCVKARSF